MPRVLLLWLLAAQCVLPERVRAQESRDIRPAWQVADSLVLAGLARSLTEGAATDSARAAAVYAWVARNIAYDLASYDSSPAGAAAAAEMVYRRRVALCGGFVALYARLARESGLVVQPIVGHAKGFGYVHGRSTRRDNHAWLAVLINGRWRLVDPTWGAGAVRDGRFEPAFSWSYFLVSPDELILSHFPKDAAWQLVDRTMSRREFERLPPVPRALLEVGFTPTDIRTTSRGGVVHDFPLVDPQSERVRVVRAPVTGTLRSAATIDIEVIWPGATDVAAVSGGVWTHFARTGDRFSGRARAAADRIWVVGRTESDPLSYRTLLHYRVE